MEKLSGWFTYAEDDEYGPTLLRWIGKGEPTEPKTRCSILDDPNWEQVWFFEDWREYCVKTDYVWKPVYYEFMVSSEELREVHDKAEKWDKWSQGEYRMTTQKRLRELTEKEKQHTDAIKTLLKLAQDWNQHRGDPERHDAICEFGQVLTPIEDYNLEKMVEFLKTEIE